jgi:uncharacterized membrane protein YhiD involved in acid resistance
MVVLGVLAAGIIALLIIASMSSGWIAYQEPAAQTAVETQASPAASPTATQLTIGDEGFFTQDVSSDQTTAEAVRTWEERTLEVIFRLLLAVILSAALAFRPRQNVPLFRRSLFVSQTQILLAVVAAALMMVVGDNTARAFAIFAAASLVRFRTNIRDPKEITVLLISLALGLAAGVGRWGLGTALCLFSLTLLWLLEYNESESKYRSMELTIKTRDTERTQQILKKIFKRKRLDAEVRELNPPDEEDPVGRIVYYLNLRLNLTTDSLSDRILAADPKNIEKIQWAKTKSADDIYQ